MPKIDVTEKAKERLSAVLKNNAGKYVRLIFQGIG